MQPFQSSKYLIQEGAVNFQEPLAGYYAERGRALDKSVAEKEAATKQKLAVLKEESPVKALEKIAKFSASAKKLAYAIKKSQEKADKKKKEEYQNKVSNMPWYVENKDNINRYEQLSAKGYEYQEQKDAAENSPHQKEFDKLHALLIENNEDAAALEIMNASGRNLIYRNEMLLRNAGTGLTPSKMLDSWAEIASNKGSIYSEDAVAEASQKLKEYDDNRNNKNKTNAMFTSWQNDQISHLELNDSTVAAVLGRELVRQNQTQRGSHAAQVVSSIASQRDLQIGASLTQANAVGDLQSGLWDVRTKLIKEKVYKDIEGGLTANQQVDAYLNNMLGRLALDGDINVSQLQPYVNLGINHPAGKTVGTTILNKEQIDSLVSKARIGEGRRVGVAMSRDTALLAEARSLKLRGDQESDAKADKMLNDITNRGLIQKEKINAVSNIEVADNTPEAYAIEKSHWQKTGRLDDGNLINHEEEIKTIKNDQLRGELQAIIKHQKERRTTLGYPKDDRKFIRIRIAQASGVTLNEEGELPGKLKDMEIHLLQRLRKDFKAQIFTEDGQPITNANSWTLANDNFETYIVKNGIDVVAGGAFRSKAKGEGIFSFDGNGKLVNFKPFQEERLNAIREQAREVTDENFFKQSQTEINAAFKSVNDNDPGLTTRDKVLNKAGSLLDEKDILGFFSQGKVSHEIIYKARKLGIPPSRLIRLQYEAMRNSNDPKYKNFFTRHDLGEIPLGPDEKLFDLVEQTGDSKLKYLFTRVDRTPNQNQRLVIGLNAWFDKNKIPGQDEKIDKRDTQQRMDAIRNLPLSRPTNTPKTKQELDEIEKIERGKILEEDYKGTEHI